MPNGQLRIALYDKNGNLKEAADSNITHAGKPAKCLWCHESGIQPLFREQIHVKGYMNPEVFLDSLEKFNLLLKSPSKSILERSCYKKQKIPYRNGSSLIFRLWNPL